MSSTLAFLGDFGDAISFIFNSRESKAGGADVGGSENLPLLWAHLKLTAAAMAIGIGVALPLGVILGHLGKGSLLAISSSNVGRAVPSIALIALFVSFFPRSSEFLNVTLALGLLAIPPILTNAYVAIQQVDRQTIDAARGMGMTGAEIVRRVELPLALPLIFGGIKTSTVNVVATATIAPLVGVLTLGDPITAQSVYGREGLMGAAIIVALLAVAAEVGLSAVQRAVTPAGVKIDSPRRNPRMKFRRFLPAVLAMLALALFVGACGGDDEEEPASGGGGTDTTASTPEASGDQITKNADNAKVSLTIGSKNFTEQKVLGEIYAQALEAAGYTVKTDLNLGDEKTALKAVESGQISAYPEYTGTALLSFFGVKADAIPKDPQQAFEDAKAGFEEKGLKAFDPTPFTSSNEVAVTSDTAEKEGLAKISDLEKVADKFTLYGSPECRQRLDCLLGLQEVYGLEFKKFTPVDIAQRHEVLTSGRADVSIVFTTDPQIKREGFVLLEDDKGMFPPYNSTLIMKQEKADEAGPDLEKTITLIQQGLTDEAMQELNARVDLDKKDPKTVATEYLTESGYIGS